MWVAPTSTMTRPALRAVSNCICCPGINRDVDRYKALGGKILGCCGDANHKYGFHVPAAVLPASDYSLRRSGPPLNRRWACAGDFGRVSWTTAWLHWLVGECRAGRKPMVVEIIGSLDGVKALYWAAWEGWVARTYAGKGHVTWTHVSLDRAKADQDPGLFVGWGPAGRAETTGAPAWPGRLLKLGVKGEDVRTWQRQMLHYYLVGVDGDYGPQSQRVCRDFQRLNGLEQDGVVGAHTWAMAWNPGAKNS